MLESYLIHVDPAANDDRTVYSVVRHIPVQDKDGKIVSSRKITHVGVIDDSNSEQ